MTIKTDDIVEVATGVDRKRVKARVLEVGDGRARCRYEGNNNPWDDMPQRWIAFEDISVDGHSFGFGLT